MTTNYLKDEVNSSSVQGLSLLGFILAIYGATSQKQYDLKYHGIEYTILTILHTGERGLLDPCWVGVITGLFTLFLICGLVAAKPGFHPIPLKWMPLVWLTLLLLLLHFLIAIMAKIHYKSTIQLVFTEHLLYAWNNILIWYWGCCFILYQHRAG